MWVEVKQALDEGRYELVLGGDEVNTLIEAASGQLDQGVYEVTQLNLLKITNTPLKTLSDDISNLVNLTNLVLQSNKLTALPCTLGSLDKLKFLDVSHNLLTQLPPSISQLSALTTLTLTANQLTSLPSLKSCTSLVVLNVNHNRLSEFPDVCYATHTHLTEIKFDNNQVEVIPLEITSLLALKVLDGAHNNIKTVPGELADCSKLKELSLVGNPLSDKRFKKLVESDRCFVRQLLDYIRQHCARTSASSGNKHGKTTSKGKKGKQQLDNDEVDLMCKELLVLGLGDSGGLPSVLVREEVKKVRPYLVCCVIHHLDLRDDLFKRFISLQNKLHDDVCEKRLVATIATHDLTKIKTPLYYSAHAPKQMMLRPLGRGGKDMSAFDLYKSLQREAEAQRKQQKRNVTGGLHRFLHMVDKWDEWPCLEDSEGNVISLPPITNSEITKITPETSSILVEVTSSSSLSRAKQVADALVFGILQNGLSTKTTDKGGKAAVVVQQVRVEDEGGGLRVLYPSHTDFNMPEEEKERVRVIMPVK